MRGSTHLVRVGRRLSLVTRRVARSVEAWARVASSPTTPHTTPLLPSTVARRWEQWRSSWRPSFLPGWKRDMSETLASTATTFSISWSSLSVGRAL